MTDKTDTAARDRTDTAARDVAALREPSASRGDELARKIPAEQELTDRLAAQARNGTQSEDLFRLLIASVVDYAIFLLDPAGKVATWNAGAERLKGYAANEIIGKHFSTFYPEADVRAGKCEHELSVARRQGRFEDEGWRVRKDGTRFWANVVITAVHSAGKLIGFAKITRDLTARKQEEERRLAVEERFRMLVESVQDYALLSLDPSGTISTWNAGAERIMGYTASEILGKHFSCFYPAEDVQAGKCERELEAATRDGRFEDESWRVRKDGSRFWANVVISAVRDKRGQLVGFSKVTRDLTEQRRSEEERTARLAAEQANKAKDEFLAVLGHELRSPLAPIVAALQLLELRGDTRGSKEYQVIDRQVKHMMHLIDDLLDVSRITQGKVELKKQHLDLRDVIAKAIEIASPLLEQRRHHFEAEVPQWPILVNGDEARLAQVFANLLTNAAKYTPPEGHIFLTMRQAGDHALIDVRDDGSGIDQELLPRLFELFVQGHRGPERAAGGLGLGLALVRSLVQLHGGRVEARSDGPGRGSTFTVRLPAVTPHGGANAGQPLADPLPAMHAKQRILIVDDNDDARVLLSDILGTIGHEVRTAADGFDALEVVKSFTPEVAILDIGLPGMDGYELATRLREAMKTAMPRLISLTGYGQQVDRDRSQAAGFDRHLVKPVDLRTLVKALTELRG